MGLASETCLWAAIAGARYEVPLPWPCCDEGPPASAALHRKRGELEVCLPESDQGPAAWPRRKGVETLAFQDLAAHDVVEAPGREACEGRLLRSPDVRRNLLWLRGLLGADQVGALLAAARAEAVAWDRTSPDSVDGLPVFESYLIRKGAAQGPLAPLLAPLAELLTAYVRRRWKCPSAVVCNALLRRYLPEERRAHPTHFDSHAFVTAVVALNAEECEGGLYVQTQPRAATRGYPLLRRGDVLLHSYDLLHGVRVFGGGVRYSLILWFTDAPEACEACLLAYRR